MSKPSLSYISHVFAPDLLLVLVIATQPIYTLRLLAFSIYLYLTSTVITFTSGSPVNDYFIGFTLYAQILVAFNFMFLYKPLNDIRHEDDPVPPRQMSFWYRLYWAFCLDHSVRAVGWSHQPKNLPPRPQEPRWTFVRSRSIRAVLYFLLADAANTYACLTDDPNLFASQRYAVSRVIAWTCVSYGTTNAQYFTAAAVTVALGISSPKNWPDLFGKPSDAYTIRKYWGTAWHQNFRRIFVPIGKAVSSALCLTPGSNASSYLQLYTAFALSAFIHGAGEAMIDAKHGWKTLPFFVLQGAAVTLEDVVLALARWGGMKASRWTYWLGYVWVTAWFAWTFSMFWRWSIEGGWNWLSRWDISPTMTVCTALGLDATRD